MNKLTSSVLGLSAAIIGGVVYFLTPQFGIDYTKKPSLPAVSLTERIVLPKSAKSELTWQNNLDKAINPNPTLMDHIFPYSLCNQVTYEKSISTITHRKTSNKPELRSYLQDQIGITNQLKKTDIDLPKSYFPLAASCTKPLEHKILTAEVQYQGLASDDNSDRGSESIFSPDDVNLSVAVKRDKKITKEIIQLTKSQPDVKITALPPSESNLSQDDIKLLLRKQFPLGTDFERQEIMSTISMLDRKMMTNSELSDIMALHRGVKISVLQKIQTQQVITFPAPLGLSPLLLLVPTVRIASFGFVRVITTSCIYILNSLARLGLFIFGQLIRILYAILRLLINILKKIKKKSSKLAIKSLRLTGKLLVLSYNQLVNLITNFPNGTNMLSKNTKNNTGKNINGFKTIIVKSSSFCYLLANSIIIKTKCFSDLFIYNTCAVITRKPQGQEFEKTYILPTVKVVILFKKPDPYNNLTYYTRLPKNKPDSVYETEKILVQIQKR